jgi:pimeloyl-ACP methyl ester carboxylesterase
METTTGGDMTATVRSKDGTVIAFTVVGPAAGPTLIEVHGATGYRAAINNAQSLAEATGYRAVSYDRRGRGESGDVQPYAVEREIEDIAALVADAPGEVWLVGESSGAVLALEAARAGVSLAGVVLYEPPFIVDDGRPPVPVEYVARLEELVAAGDRLGAFKYFSLTAVGMPESMVEGIEHGPWWSLVEPVAHTISYDGRIMGDMARGSRAPLERYREMTTPALVFVGSETFPFMHAATEAIAGVLPASQLVRLAGADHQLVADTVAPAVMAFVERTRA